MISVFVPAAKIAPVRSRIEKKKHNPNNKLPVRDFISTIYGIGLMFTGLLILSLPVALGLLLTEFGDLEASSKAPERTHS
jgi:hypothetical protein